MNEDVYPEVLRSPRGYGDRTMTWEFETNVHFPVSTSQFKSLLGKVLTHIEAMGLPEVVEAANKKLIKETLWKWWETVWETVEEGSITSANGCIAPIDLRQVATDA
jgi:hypothetical protein